MKDIEPPSKHKGVMKDIKRDEDFFFEFEDILSTKTGGVIFDFLFLLFPY